MRKKTIFIVDDSSDFRAYVKKYLANNPSLKIIGEAENARQALRQIKELHPDLVLMDIRTPEMNGFTASRLLKKEMPDLHIIILTIFDIPKYRESAKESGAEGYVMKSKIIKDLVPAMRKVLKKRKKHHEGRA